jgi:phosphate transport system ATP-binding protein
MSKPILDVREVEVRAGNTVLISSAQFEVAKGEVFGLIGPSGAGKSTLLRSLNRLNDLAPGLQVRADVLLQGWNIYAADADVNAVRARVGMLFQQPVVFPESIAENVLFGAKRLRSLSRSERAALIESSLREAALWEEVRDRLNRSATTLSVGQQQRLCLARALAVGPDVLLMDEPTSALDPKSTAAIEELVRRLKERLAIVIVTHNLAQARRVTDRLACLCVREGVGQIIEQGTADAMLCCPQTNELAEYVEHAQ